MFIFSITVVVSTYINVHEAGAIYNTLGVLPSSLVVGSVKHAGFTQAGLPALETGRNQGGQIATCHVIWPVGSASAL